MVDQDAGQIAHAINGHAHDKSYDQIIVGYLQELGRELRRREGETYTELHDRVNQLLGSLDQETMSRLLSVGGDLASRQELVADFASSLPVKAVLDLIQAAGKAEKQTISSSLLRMLTKLADHADHGSSSVRSSADEGLPGGGQRPALRLDAGRSQPRQLHPGAGSARAAHRRRWRGRRPPADDHMQEAPRILQMAIEIDVVGQAVLHAVGALVESGQLQALVETLDGAPAGSPRPRPSGAHLATPDMVTGILRHGDAHIDVVEHILDKIGGAALEPMLDALSTTDSRGMRHRLLNALTALGSVVGPPAARRLEKAEWFVQRNLLIVLGALPEWPTEFDPVTVRPRRRRPGAARGDQADAAGHPAARTSGTWVSSCRSGTPTRPSCGWGWRRHWRSARPPSRRTWPGAWRTTTRRIRVLAIRVLGTLRSIRGRELLLGHGPGPEDLVAPHPPGAAHPGNAGRAPRPGRDLGSASRRAAGAGAGGTERQPRRPPGGGACLNSPVKFLTSLGQVMATMALYNRGHPARERALDDSFQELTDLLADGPALRFSFIGGDVVYDRRVLRELKGWDWAVRLADLGIERLEIDRGVTRDDFEQFLRDTFQRSRGEALDTAEVRQLRATAIRYGTLSVETPEALSNFPATLATATMAYSLRDDVEAIQWMHEKVRETGELPLLEAETVVRSLAIAMHSQSEIIVPLLQLKEFDQYTTTHSTNVSVLAMALGEALGFAGRELRVIGVSGLLHDLGKVKIPREILVKPGGFTDEEFAIMKAHPMRGPRSSSTATYGSRCRQSWPTNTTSC